MAFFSKHTVYHIVQRAFVALRSVSMLRRLVCVSSLVFVGSLVACGGSSIGSGAFEDPGGSQDGATTEESGTEDSGGMPSDTSVTPGDTSVTPTDTDVATDTSVTPDTSVPPPDTEPPPPPDTSVPCTEPTAMMFEGHCYFLINKRQFNTARDFCVSLGAHLVTINSDAEQGFLDTFGAAEDRWIGLFRPEGSPFMESSYKWVTPEAVTFKNWDPGEPNFSGPCVRMRNDGSWADQGCTNTIYGICERE